MNGRVKQSGPGATYISAGVPQAEVLLKSSSTLGERHPNPHFELRRKP